MIFIPDACIGDARCVRRDWKSRRRSGALRLPTEATVVSLSVVPTPGAPTS